MVSDNIPQKANLIYSNDRMYSGRMAYYRLLEGNAGIIRNGSVMNLELRWCWETDRFSR